MSLEETFTQTIEASPLYTYMRIAWHEQLSEGNETAEAISEKHVSNLASELVAVVKQRIDQDLPQTVEEALKETYDGILRPSALKVDARTDWYVQACKQVLFGETEAER